MRKKLLFICLLITLNSIAQKSPKIITGTVFIDSIAVQDVHIINTKLDIGTITNKSGQFEMLAAKGDALIISHINFQFKEYTITAKDLATAKIKIHLNAKDYLLDEVVIKKRKGIFEIDKDILPHNAPIVNAKTLRLPYANSKQPNKDKTVKINAGVAVNLEGLVNALNGKNKQKKKLKKLMQEDDNILQIRKHFTDGFFIKQLNIKKENIQPFLEYCIAKGIINLYKKDKMLELTAVLIDNSKNTPYISENRNTRVTLK